MTFTEFAYMLLQSYDFQQLYDRTMGYKTAGTCGPPRIPM